jgi:hypothetical protein
LTFEETPDTPKLFRQKGGEEGEIKKRRGGVTGEPEGVNLIYKP